MKCKCPKCGYQYCRREFNDNKLIKFCKKEEKTSRQIAEHLGIAVKNVIVRLDRLEQKGFIAVKRSGKGKPHFIRSLK